MRHELQLRLEEADVASPDAIADDMVTMNSTVRLLAADGQTCITRTVTYPDDADLMSGGVSILEPLGCLLLGRKVGDVFTCDCGRDMGRWRVEEVTYQPERAGAYHR
jgi:regulator of nucleoside diphosphate kinase